MDNVFDQNLPIMYKFDNRNQLLVFQLDQLSAKLELERFFVP